MFAPNSVKLSISPIAWTNDDLPELGGHISFEQCIEEMAEAGFAGSEIGNKYPRDPDICLLYTSPSPRDRTRSRMPSSA